MNKQTLQNIANHTAQVSTTEIEEIKQLIGNYPFYSLPHVVLAKIYFEKEHYLFENALNQAAMRVNDREWLYHYIHGDEAFDKHAIEERLSAPIAEQLAESDKQEPSIHTDEIETAETLIVADEEGLTKNDLKEFLSDLSISQPLEDTEENIQHSDEEIPFEVSDENSEAEAIEPVNSEAEEEDSIIETDLEKEAFEEPITQSVEIEIANPIETVSNVNDLDTQEADPVVEIAEEDHDGVVQVVESHSERDLRKHPVYNVESFLKDEAEDTSNANSIDVDEEKDFFYWLNHPKPEVIESEVADISAEEEEEENSFEADKTLSIIEQFIKANPSISRPKKEFYSAENMAKRSENVDFEFVTETLANIYYEQGNIDLAIKAYEKLSLQNPLKQAYFASLIEKIKKEKR